MEEYLQLRLGQSLGSVLDLGSGWGEFSYAVQANLKFSVDIEIEWAKFVAGKAEFSVQDAAKLAFAENSIEVIFMSNLLEHIPDRLAMLQVLKQVYRVLMLNGRVAVMGPNFKYTYRQYFDFFDHYCEYTDRSMVEALQLAGFEKFMLVIPRFLPFSTKQGLPTHSWLVRWYLRIPLAWRVLGKQFLIIAEK